MISNLISIHPFVRICTLEVFPFAAGEGSGDVFGELGALGPHLIVGPQLCGV